MSNPHLQQRILTYADLSTTLAYLDNTTLTDLFENALETSQGWGINHILQIGTHKIFVKRIPLPDLIHQHPYSTKNWHRLPTFYSYPVGSAGINSFRELAAHIKTTNWVLSDQCVHFPLMYHHRIVSRQPTTAPIDEARFKRYLAGWNNDEQIRDYMLARRAANQELVLFLEYFPHELGNWFQHNVASTESIVAQMKAVLKFMRDQKFIHFDLTFNNIMTDGKQIYVADFGLSNDAAFELQADERALIEQSASFDAGTFLRSLAFYVIIRFNKLSAQEKQAISAEFNLSGEKSLTAHDKSRLIENIEQLAKSSNFPIEQNFVDVVLQYHDIILLMQDFIGSIFENGRKDTPYPYEKLEQHLQASGLGLPRDAWG